MNGFNGGIAPGDRRPRPIRFLFTVWPFAGHVHPALAVAIALRERGHEAAFYTGGSMRSVIESEGFRCFPFVKVDEEKVVRLAVSEFSFSTTLRERIRSARELQARFREWLLDTVPQQADDIGALMAGWRPDVLVCDLAFWSPVLVLGETYGMPVAVLSVLAACLLPGRDAPAWGRGLPRPRTGIPRLRSAVERTLIHWFSGGFRGEVNALRRRYGLRDIACSVTEYAGRMPLYLVPSASEYDYDRSDLPASVHYVGPCLWDKPRNAPRPSWIAQLRGGQPVVYVTEATVGTGEPFLLRAAARAFRGLRLQVVMTTGRQRDPAALDLGDLGPNFRVESYVPQSDLLPEVAVMVTPGGSGGVLAALQAGVPLVVVPTEWDRPENAQRVVEAGAGLRIAPARCTPERLRAAVERVLSETSFRRNAQRLAGALARYRGPSRAAELLEELGGRTETPGLRATALRQGTASGSYR